MAAYSSRQDQKSKRRTYRIKHQLPPFIKRGGKLVAKNGVTEQVILELTRSKDPRDDVFNPEFDRFVTIPAGHEIQTFTSGRGGTAFFIADVIDGRPGGRLPTTVFQLTFYVFRNPDNLINGCDVEVEIRGYSGQGRARITRLGDAEDSELTVLYN